ncbi:MAG TPA: YicC family protein [Candidatus Ruminococcus avistercoris]|nr:YicC family protein [Candidatus Ruminococcus avistercoris]
MMKSMTGYGRSEFQNDLYKFTVEMKSVNHRYLDFNFKIPKKLGALESGIRSVLKEYIQRGKIDVFITYENYTQERINLKYNHDLAGQYLTCLRQIEKEFALPNDVTASVLSRFPEVFTMEEQPADEEELWEGLKPVLRQAAQSFVNSREREGEALQRDLLEKLDAMYAKVLEVEKRSPEITREYREKLEKKMKELLEDTQIEESRIAAEVILFADKICTDEETVRLKSHIDTMKHVLQDGEGIGRKLDFIAQEMNREANTILAKANDIATSNVAIDLKTEIEKVREQIQNIE